MLTIKWITRRNKKVRVIKRLYGYDRKSSMYSFFLSKNRNSEI